MRSVAASPEVERARELALSGRPYDALRSLATEETARALGEACDRLEDEAARRACAAVVGDAYFIQLKLDEAIDWYERSDADWDPVTCAKVAAGLGRVPTVDRLLDAGRVGSWEVSDVLLVRALENVRMGGDASLGFWIDEAAIDLVARRWGAPREELLAGTVRGMLRHGSRHDLKHYLLARHSKDPELIARTEPAFQARADEPRSALGRRLREALRARGGALGETLQRGDDDDWNPRVAALWRGELDGRAVILKEHLRLPIDISAAWAYGWSDERSVLGEVTPHPSIAPLLETLAIGRHEVLVLGVAPGEDLGRRLARDGNVPVAEARRLAKAVAQAVAHLHSHDVMWLDVKPENIVDDGMTTTLVDFGMAQRGGPYGRSLLSTAAYVEPGMARTFVGGREVDVFQLGLLLVELITGRHAFAGVPITHGRDEPREAQLVRYALATLWREPDLTGLPDDLRSLAASALSRDADARPTAAAFAEAL